MDGRPILIGDEVQWRVTRDEPWGPGIGTYSAVVHEVACEEIRIGGMTSDDEEWEDQVHPDELLRVSASGSGQEAGTEQAPPVGEWP